MPTGATQQVLGARHGFEPGKQRVSKFMYRGVALRSSLQRINLILCHDSVRKACPKRCGEGISMGYCCGRSRTIYNGAQETLAAYWLQQTARVLPMTDDARSRHRMCHRVIAVARAGMRGQL
jgi:hypothetical protein